MTAPKPHPYQQFANYATRLAPGETVTYYCGPSLAHTAEADPDFATIREGFLCLGSPAGETIREWFGGGERRHRPPEGFGMGFLTQEKIRRDGEITKFAYRFTRSKDAAQGAAEADPDPVAPMLPGGVPEHGDLHATVPA